ncbi:polycomb group protein Psc-like [Maniola jurtina]|uniref:polycomb group protein Psc-like n=1 Tax=Maniola jurtina TaxID=191418 RepID=UPI001E68B513|nr:polycomb group protein Psc-like [Maniola jurtina]
MVTSNKQSDKKVVKMTEQNNSVVVPQRTLLGEVNEQITCPLCRGYYIDATTIVECLHSFCRSCIIKHLQVKSYCPVCEMMINSAKPNIKLDKALQDIVYKLVPGLFQKEMERRQQFYASRPGQAASATPEQRGEDTERIIFSPEDVISFSLEYADITDADSISSKSSDSNEPPSVSLTTRRFLQCPAVVNISHLKKFLSMKFDIDSTQFAIDILYKRVPLPDYYTLMDIAYIYNWKRNEPMRFFYQIIDYVAIRNRLFDINRKGTHFPDRKSSPTCTEDTNVSSPAPNVNDQGSEASSGNNSPMPDDNNTKKVGDTTKKNEALGQKVKDTNAQDSTSAQTPRCSSPVKKNDDEVEKSQFLNSFELTAKSTSTTSKSPSTKPNNSETNMLPKDGPNKSLASATKTDDTLKRKFESSKMLPEMKKIKIEIEKTKIPLPQSGTSGLGTIKISNLNDHLQKPTVDLIDKVKKVDEISKPNLPNASNNTQTLNQMSSKEVKPQQFPTLKQHLDSPAQKRPVAVPQTSSSPKRKPSDVPSAPQPSLVQKTVSPLKLQIPKPETQSSNVKHVELPKPIIKKMPDLKPSIPPIPTAQNKGPPIGKLRMDLLANNCDPTIDRSKILSQVKTSLPTPNTPPSSGDPLKSLFDSCKINIPSSLSITLTDQKLDPRSPSDPNNSDPKKNIVNKNLSTASTTSTHKVPSPPVHNYIEILKLPDTDPKKPNKPEPNIDKTNVPNKSENNSGPPKPPTKSSETSAKGPVPNLKPISDTKLAKQSANFTQPITFQQTFEQQLQSLQSDKKSKLPKNKTQVPKLVPATPKSFTAANKLNNTVAKPNPTNLGNMEGKALALDLSTPHNIQSQLGPQHTKAFETMQSIANLAKKQNIPSKAVPMPMAPANSYAGFSNRSLPTSAPPLRVPSASTINQLKLDKINANGSQVNPPPRSDPNPPNNPVKQTNNASPTISSPNYPHNPPSATQPSPRSQTRSPSSSPKLVIAEEKQANSTSTELNLNQSNQITSTQLSNTSTPKVESPKASPGPSKAGIKSLKPQMPPSKVTGIRQPITPTMNTTQPINSPADYLTQPQLISHAHRAMLRHQMEMQNAWLKMASLQTTIPFKSRKRAYYNETKIKSNNENEDILNIDVLKSPLKRKLEDKITETNDTKDLCSAKKISRKQKKCADTTDALNIGNSPTENALKPLVGREKEIEFLENFLTEQLDKGESASLYVSGQPGTGKTASLSYILQTPKIRDGYKQVYINCLMMKSAASIYCRICKELQITTSGTSEKACLSAIEKYLFKKHNPILLILDEIDQLESKRQSVLYTIFEWASTQETRLVLVGIANALDLTQRSLPRLQARANLRPATLHFPPYTKQQIIDIFTHELSAEDTTNVFSPVALQMLAAKIAAVSGDLRRALDLGRRVIDLARRSKFSENQSVDKMLKDSSVTVELKQVLEVLNDIYGGCRNIDADAEDRIPMHQKLILCSLMLMLTKGKSKEIVMGKLHDVYKRVAKARNIAPMDLGEVAWSCSLLENRGALRVCGGAVGAPTQRLRLRLQWDEAELGAAMRDKPLLSAILADSRCLTA